MKKTMMISTLLSLTFIVSAANAAETVTEKISTNKKWSAYTLAGHAAWTGEACVASTLGDKAILEVYAEKSPAGYVEPTVQVLFSGVPNVYSAEVSTDASQKWQMTLASTPADPTLLAMMSRLGDRQKMIDSLKQHNTFTVKLKDIKNKVVKQLSFSLSGSSKTIDEQMKKCVLKFEEV